MADGTKVSKNDDGSDHVTRYQDGSHRSYDRNADGSKSNDHTTDHSTGKHYYSQDTNDGKHKEGDVTNSKGNNVSQGGLDEWNSKHK